MDPTVGHFLGYSIGLGMLVSVLTQIVKTVESIPYLSRIPGMQWVINKIEKGKPEEIRIFVCILAVLTNAVSVYLNTGTVVDVATLWGSAASFFTSLGTYDLVFKGKEERGN